MLGLASGKVPQEARLEAGLFNVIRPFAFAYSTSIPTFLERQEDREAISSMITFQKDGSHALEKDIPGL